RRTPGRRRAPASTLPAPAREGRGGASGRVGHGRWSWVIAEHSAGPRAWVVLSRGLWAEAPAPWAEPVRPDPGCRCRWSGAVRGEDSAEAHLAGGEPVVGLGGLVEGEGLGDRLNLALSGQVDDFAEVVLAAVRGSDDLLAHHVERHTVRRDRERAGEVQTAEDHAPARPQARHGVFSGVEGVGRDQQEVRAAEVGQLLAVGDDVVRAQLLGEVVLVWRVRDRDRLEAR